ncbi:hypothetical protein HAX54_009999, partial [Datura stramonium]|nr:hypothetical protein [Datura stramonium]
SNKFVLNLIKSLRKGEDLVEGFWVIWGLPEDGETGGDLIGGCWWVWWRFSGGGKVRGDKAAAGSVVLPVLMGFRRVTGVYGGSPGSGGFGWQWCCSPEKTSMGEGLREMRRGKVGEREAAGREKTRERKGGSVGFRRVRRQKKWGEGRVEGERRRSVVAVEVGGRGRLEE